MPIMTYGGFKRMTGFCKTKVPKSMSDELDALKDDEEAVKVSLDLILLLHVDAQHVMLAHTCSRSRACTQRICYSSFL